MTTGLSRLQGRLDRAAIKYIAALTMLIDHITCGFLEAGRGADGRALMYSVAGGKLLDQIGRGIGRTAFPIFCFFVVEGYLHTKNRLRYLLLMIGFGAAAHYPFKMLFYPRSAKPHTDTMFTLALGFLCIWAIDELSERLDAFREYLPARVGSRTAAGGMPARAKTKAVESGTAGTGTIAAGSGAGTIAAGFGAAGGKDRRRLREFAVVAGGIAVTAALGFVAKKIGSDYTYGGVVAIVLLYVLYRQRDTSLMVTWCWLSFYNSSELLSILGFALLLCYNGEKGRSSKYIFYIFYPGHLLALYLIRRALMGA